ncbi:hypothetical protein [Paenibacillus ginsengihumi]|uniref:hypothetical protein n=1 Tax=Paenibacillus ginsengihumi TaxID=431596 RepID=UPI00047813B4|nr:hypothetical protein [Paenibacillus ginsengihumi]
MTKRYTPKSGDIVASDGTVHNIVDLLGGGTPLSDEVSARKYTPQTALVTGSDGKVYDLVELLRGIGGGKIDPGELPDIDWDDDNDSFAVRNTGASSATMSANYASFIIQEI